MPNLIEKLWDAGGPDRQLDAEIMFDLFAKPVGTHQVDGGPTGYLWPEDNVSWNFGLRFPGKDRAWFDDVRKRNGETLVIERDGALVLMNDLRIPKLTGSLDDASSLIPKDWYWTINSHGYATLFKAPWNLLTDSPIASSWPENQTEADKKITPAIGLCIAYLKSREKISHG